MKILILVATYYPQKNGVQGVTQYQAEGLAALGHEVTVITSSRYCPIEHEMHNGVEILRIYCYTQGMLYFGDKKKYISILREKIKNVDVILSVCIQSWVTDLFLPLIDQLNVPKALMIHGMHDFRWSNFKNRSVYGLLRKVWGDIRWPLYFKQNWENFKQFDAIAQLHEKDFATLYFNKHDVQNQNVLYNAVDDEFFAFTGEKKNQIVNVGTYAPGKNQIACLQAFYRADLPNWKLVLIGSSKNRYYEKLLQTKQKLERKFGKRDVEIKVGITRQETIRNICESKIYLLTSISEKFPVSLIEAMAAGCAWISTDVGINAYLPGGKIADTPAEMAQLVEESAQDENWKKLGEQGKQFTYENCKKETQVKKLEQILQNAIQNYKNKTAIELN